MTPHTKVNDLLSNDNLLHKSFERFADSFKLYLLQIAYARSAKCASFVMPFAQEMTNNGLSKNGIRQLHNVLLAPAPDTYRKHNLEDIMAFIQTTSEKTEQQCVIYW